MRQLVVAAAIGLILSLLGLQHTHTDSAAGTAASATGVRLDSSSSGAKRANYSQPNSDGMSFYHDHQKSEQRVNGSSLISSTNSRKKRSAQLIEEAASRRSAARRHLRLINKQPLKSIQSSDGDIIDCVPRDKQPALDHPLLKDHVIETSPSSIPEGWRNGQYSWQRLARQQSSAFSQLWHQNGSCPDGTIPVRRTSMQDLMRASAYDPKLYGRKTHKPAGQQRNYNPDQQHDDPTATINIGVNIGSSTNHEHAIAFMEGSELYGARAVLSVWDPWVEASNEFSLSQIWVLGGSFDGDLNSIEAGWQVSPELYGDNYPRLFIYWTTDGYQATGCYNLLCSGFIQTSDTVAIGATIAPVSNFGGNQYQIEIMIWKDPRQGNWWMAFEGSHIVGYWPASLFSHLSRYANMVEWGGEVVNSNPNGHHTGTQMGSGRFAEGGFGSASFFHSLQVVDSSNSLQPVSNLQTLAEHPNCYDIRSLQDPNWGASFYYGGPGRNNYCN